MEEASTDQSQHRERRSVRERDRETRSRNELSLSSARRMTVTQASAAAQTHRDSTGIRAPSSRLSEQRETSNIPSTSTSSQRILAGSHHSDPISSARRNASTADSLSAASTVSQSAEHQSTIRHRDPVAPSTSSQGSNSPLPVSVDIQALLASNAAISLPIHPSLNARDGIPLAPEADAGRVPAATLDIRSLQPPVLSSGRARSRQSAQALPSLANVSSVEDLRSDQGSGSGSEEGVEEAEMSGDCADPEDSEAEPNRTVTSQASSSRTAVDENPEDRRTPRAARRSLAPLAPNDVSNQSSGMTLGDETPHAPTMGPRSDTVTPRESLTQAESTSSRQSSHNSHHHHPSRDRHATVTSRTRPVLPTTYIAETFDPTDMAFREEEVLLSLQILAYLTKYSHIRALLRFPEMTRASNLHDLDELWDKAQTSPGTPMWQPGQQFHRSIYTIAERYTCRATRRDPNAEYVAGGSKLAPLIQYWAGVVMRNACRKDDREGDVHTGLRQCGNMLCGKWETEPREFAKCRRCKKAKFCSKVCQSTSWQIGHKYWCSSVAEESETGSRSRSHRSAQHEHEHEHEHEDERAPAEAVEPAANGIAGLVTGAMPVDEVSLDPNALTGDMNRMTDTAETVRAREQATPTFAPARDHPTNDVVPVLPSGALAPAARRHPPRRPSGFNRNQSIPSRLVSEAASTAASDMSEDEAERSRFILQSDGEASETNEGRSSTMPRGPPPAPLRTDIAGRPLPPPVIAGTGIDLAVTPAFVAENGLGGPDDSFGGRFTPGVEEQFGRADIDQITWRGQTPTPDPELIRSDAEDLEIRLYPGTDRNGTAARQMGEDEDASGAMRTPISNSIPLDPPTLGVEGSPTGSTQQFRRYPTGSRLEAHRSVSSVRPRSSDASTILPSANVARRAASGLLSASPHGPSMSQSGYYEDRNGSGTSTARSSTLRNHQTLGQPSGYQQSQGQHDDSQHHLHPQHQHQHQQQQQYRNRYEPFNFQFDHSSGSPHMITRSTTPNPFGSDGNTPTVGASGFVFGRAPPGRAFAASALSSPAGSQRGALESQASAYLDDLVTPHVERHDPLGQESLSSHMPSAVFARSSSTSGASATSPLSAMNDDSADAVGRQAWIEEQLQHSNRGTLGDAMELT